MGEVTDDGDVATLEVPEAAFHRVGVEQGLRRVLVGAVAGVDDVRVDPLADLLGRPARVVPDDEGVDPHGRDGQDGVAQGLPLGGRRPLAADVDDVGRQPLPGDLERAARARRVLEEEVDHGPAAQGRELLHLALLHPVHLGGRVEDGPYLRAVQVRRREQVPTGTARGRLPGQGRAGAHRPCPPAMVTWSSMPSCSLSRTETRSTLDVGRFLPTWSARIGSSRWPRSTRTASRTARGRPEVGQRVEGGAHGAARVQDVVDQDDDLVVDATARDVGVPRATGGLAAQVVTVHRHVEGTHRDRSALDALHDGGQPLGQDDPAARDAQDHQVGPTLVVLEDLVGHPPQRARDVAGREHGPRRRRDGRSGSLRGGVDRRGHS